MPTEKTKKIVKKLQVKKAKTETAPPEEDPNGFELDFGSTNNNNNPAAQNDININNNNQSNKLKYTRDREGLAQNSDDEAHEAYVPSEPLADDHFIQLSTQNTKKKKNRKNTTSKDEEDALLDDEMLPKQYLNLESNNNNVVPPKQEADEKDDDKLEFIGPMPAWQDEDDQDLLMPVNDPQMKRKLKIATHQTEITARELSQNLNQMVQKGSTSWAEIKEQDNKEVDQLFQKTRSLIDRQARGLPTDILDVHQLPSLQHPNQKFRLVQCKFHPNSYHFVTMGHSGGKTLLSLWKLDGQKNERVSTGKINGELAHGAFIGQSDTMLLSPGMKAPLWTYNVETNKANKVNFRNMEAANYKKVAASPVADTVAVCSFGKVSMFGKNAEWLFDLKINQPVADAAFSADGANVFIASNRYVYLYDVRTRQCVRRWTDDAGLHLTSLAASRNGQWFATAADSGYVNVYSAPECIEGNAADTPKPRKTFSNTVIAVNQLEFNGASEILSVVPKTTTEMISLIHIPNFSVFRPITPLGLKARSVAFSPNNAFLAAAYPSGTVALYQFDHYKN